MQSDAIGSTGLHLAALSVGYVRLIADEEVDNQEFIYRLIRLLPPIYTALVELRPYGEDEGGDNYDNYDTDAILSAVTEEQYQAVAASLAARFGQYDTYLDVPAEDLRYGDTPVALSLSEQLSDIYQALGDFASTIAEAPSAAVPDILAELKYRFHSYLSDTICSALRVANNIYQTKVLCEE